MIIGVLQKWTVGRVIDYIADCAGLHNPNNTGAATVSMTATFMFHSVCGGLLDVAHAVCCHLLMG